MRRRDDIRSARGQTMVEFVMVLPILMMILFGIIQFGITFGRYVALTDSVRAGARTAAVSRLLPAATRDSVIKNRVKTASGDLDPSKVTPTVTSTWQHGDDVVVTATYPYSISLLGIVVKSGNLSSSTTERVE